MRNAPSPREFARLVPDYTNDAPTNAMFATLGVARLERLFQKLPRPLTSNGSAVQFDISRAYRVQITEVEVPAAVQNSNDHRLSHTRGRIGEYADALTLRSAQ